LLRPVSMSSRFELLRFSTLASWRRWTQPRCRDAESRDGSDFG